MECERCKSEKTVVAETRERMKFVYRKRKCMNCGYTFITHEIFVREAREGGGIQVIRLSSLKNWTEAIWLELADGRLIATSVKEIDELTVHFANNMSMSRASCLSKWRAWNRKPNDEIRRKEKWRITLA